MTPRDAADAEIRRIRRMWDEYRTEIPVRCGRCGSSKVSAMHLTNRRSWACAVCQREMTPGGIG